jgi:hypothetical protein
MSARTITTLVLIYAGFSALGIAAGATIVRKAGYSPWWIVTGFIPLVNVVMAFTFAFADWPVLKEGRRASRLQASEPRGHPSFGVAPSVTMAFAPAAPTYDPAASVAPAPAPYLPPGYPQHGRHGA